MKTTIQQTDAWRLDVELIETKYGATVRFLSFVPTARRPEEQVKLQLHLSHAELERLQNFFSEAVAAATI